MSAEAATHEGEDIQRAEFMASSLLDQFSEHLEEIDAAAREILEGRAKAGVGAIRLKRISDLTDRARDFVGLAQDQLSKIRAYLAAEVRREIDEAITTERRAAR